MFIEKVMDQEGIFRFWRFGRGDCCSRFADFFRFEQPLRVDYDLSEALFAIESNAGVEFLLEIFKIYTDFCRMS